MAVDYFVKVMYVTVVVVIAVDFHQSVDTVVVLDIHSAKLDD